jgi:hypothetical protein
VGAVGVDDSGLLFLTKHGNFHLSKIFPAKLRCRVGEEPRNEALGTHIICARCRTLSQYTIEKSGCKEEKDRFFREFVSAVKIGTASEKWKINSDLENKNTAVDFSDSISVPDYSVVSGDIHLFMLPHFKYDLCDLTSKNRDHTVEWQVKGIRECNYEIKLPDSLKIKYMPQSQEFSFNNEKFRISYQCDAGVLKVSYMSESNTAFVALKDYKKLQKYLEQRMQLSKQYIILENAK